jgi:endonuclease/exonuclease/phosphatase family metal-dependent hydrolase
MTQLILIPLSLLAVSVAAGAASDDVWRGRTLPTVPMPCELKVLTWNIERGRRLPGVAETLAREASTLALLQEVDVHARRTGRRHVPEELATRLALNYFFGVEFEEMGQGRRDAPAYQGQATLTALPVLSTRVLRFQNQTGYWEPRWYLPNWAIFQRRTGGRMALVSELGNQDRMLVVYNVHLESREDEGLRLRQMRELLRDADRYPQGAAFVVAGDLNTRRPDAPAITALVDAGFRLAAGGEVTTLRGAALDWIFVRGPLEFNAAAVHRETVASDHFPVSARIRWPEGSCR